MARSHKPVKLKFKGITKDASALKISRAHLWMVLTGHRASKILSARYKALKKEAA
jgi:hypothetical protein